VCVYGVYMVCVYGVVCMVCVVYKGCVCMCVCMCVYGVYMVCVWCVYGDSAAKRPLCRGQLVPWQRDGVNLPISPCSPPHGE